MGLCILEVYKDGKQPPNNLSSIRDISQWYESLAIPSDYQLVPKEWGSKIILRLPADLSIGSLQISLELALHLGVYGIVISSNLLKPEYGQVCKEFIKNHRSHLRFYLNALESAWTEWVQQWRSDPVFVKSLKACIVIDAKQTVRNHKWLHESVGLVDCQLRPVIFDDNWMRFMTLCNIPIVCTEPAYNANDVLLKLTDPVELLCAPYNDILQVPLKPWCENLPNGIYENFEEDRTKYDLYERAMEKALVRLSQSKGGRAWLNVAILGVGRGPLLDRLLQARRKVDEDLVLHIYAVDKNPNAILGLIGKKARREDWTCVEIVFKDMREWKPAVRMDLIVSELLGSFGDNELSPECLDGAQRLLNPDGSSFIIPQSYTSWIEPVYSPRLYKAFVELAELDRSKGPFVCKMFHPMFPSSPRPVFTFSHPSKDSSEHNQTRTLSWDDLSKGSLVDGFAGYFVAILFDDVTISTLRGCHTESLFSWFPMFFPLETPLSIDADDRLSLEIKRISEGDLFRYSWMPSKKSEREY